MKIGATTLSDALAIAEPTELYLSSYSLDEWELFSLAYWGGWFATPRVCVRFDPAAYRGTKGRVIEPNWLKPFKPPVLMKSQPRRVPPIFHAKLGLALRTNASRAVVSTANIASSDQRRAGNVQIAMNLDNAAARRVRRWITGVSPARTLCILLEGSSKASVVESDQSTWHLFRKLKRRYARDPGEWILCAPFWATAALKRVRAEGASRVSAYFADAHQARKVVAPIAHPSIECFAPNGAKRFHQKVVAWRSSGRNPRVILYIGSANMTPSGFFGADESAELMAWNWEAGVLLVGGGELWRLAVQAAGTGVSSWRRIVVKPNGSESSDEIPPAAELEDELEGRLRVHLSRAVRLHGRRVERIDGPHPENARLASVVLLIGAREQGLSIGSSVPVPEGVEFVGVLGVYRCKNGLVRSISFELPSLSARPQAGELPRRVAALRALLYARGCGGGPDEPTDPEWDGMDNATRGDNGWALDDVRFPFRELLELHRRAPAEATRWLRHVEHECAGDQGIGLWSGIAGALRRDLA